MRAASSGTAERRSPLREAKIEERSEDGRSILVAKDGFKNEIQMELVEGADGLVARITKFDDRTRLGVEARSRMIFEFVTLLMDAAIEKGAKELEIPLEDPELGDKLLSMSNAEFLLGMTKEELLARKNELFGRDAQTARAEGTWVEPKPYRISLEWYNLIVHPEVELGDGGVRRQMLVMMPRDGEIKKQL